MQQAKAAIQDYAHVGGHVTVAVHGSESRMHTQTVLLYSCMAVCCNALLCKTLSNEGGLDACKL